MSNVNITVDDDLVTPIVESKIAAAIVQELDKTPHLIEKIVMAALNENVDPASGKVSTSYNSVSYIQWLASDAVRAAAKEAMHEYIVKKRTAIKKEMKKQLELHTDDFATLICRGLEESLKADWKLRCYVKFETDKD